MKDLLYVQGVVTLELNENLCNGCGMCIKVCPHEVFVLSERKAHIIRKDHCMECGACQMNCQMDALTVNSGVGCAAGIISGILNNTEPICGCSEGKSTCC